LTVYFRQGSVGTHVRRDGQYIHMSDCWKFIHVLLCQIL